MRLSEVNLEDRMRLGIKIEQVRFVIHSPFTIFVLIVGIWLCVGFTIAESLRWLHTNNAWLMIKKGLLNDY